MYNYKCTDLLYFAQHVSEVWMKLSSKCVFRFVKKFLQREAWVCLYHSLNQIKLFIMFIMLMLTYKSGCECNMNQRWEVTYQRLVSVLLYFCDFSSLHMNTFSKEACFFSFDAFEVNYGLLLFGVFITRPISDVRRRKQTERETGMWRKGVLVSRICREFLIFSLCCCSGRFTNPTCVCVTSWE